MLHVIIQNQEIFALFLLQESKEWHNEWPYQLDFMTRDNHTIMPRQFGCVKAWDMEAY